MLDRIAGLATVRVLAGFLVALAVVELVLRQVLGPEYQLLLSLVGLALALGLLVIGGAPLLQEHLARRRDGE
ncbi:hypothetical protein ACKVMT_14250 [Halobacteriales archaeon Cl-PHB]